MRERGRRGATLIELVVALGVLAIAATMTLLAIREPQAPADDAAGVGLVVAGARRTAIITGRPQLVRADPGGGPAFLALPDGSIVGDSALEVERLSGVPTPSRRGR